MAINSQPIADTGVNVSSLVELLQQRGVYQPAAIAYRFLADGETKELNLSYGDLYRRARAVAALLQEAHAEGERALLLYPSGVDYVAAFFGCLLAGVVAVPAYPPRLNRHAARLEAMAADAGASLALTNTPLLSRRESFTGQTPAFQRLRWLATDTLADGLAEAWREPPTFEARGLAYLQYTSGSTSAPKGVMVTHANVLHNSAYIHQGFAHTPDSISLTWLPHFHDMGLLDGIIQPVYGGFTGIIMSPTAFLQRPARWLEAVTRYRVTHTGGPNFAYDLCARRTSDEQRATLDLSSWSVAYNGAEPVSVETLRRFADAFAPCGFRSEAFYPAYGLAEATLKVSGGSRGVGALTCTVNRDALEQHRVVDSSTHDADARTLVSSGQAGLETEVLIVNPEKLVECAPAEVGEIWVRGPGVAAGYWNRPAETEQVFRARLAHGGAGAYLRTGDLGFLRRGELYVTGRLKDLIIIRGRNLYPQDIEAAVERCAASLRPAGGAAFSVETNGAEHLVVVQELEPRKPSDPPVLVEAIRRTLAEEFEVQPSAVLLVKAGSVPKTSSGKIQRNLCRRKFMRQEFDPIAEWHSSHADLETELSAPPDILAPSNTEDVETWLRARLARMLRVDAASIDAEQPVTHYGVDSLMAVELLHGLETTLGVVLPLSDFFQSPGLAEIARRAFDELQANQSRAPHEAALLPTNINAVSSSAPSGASSSPSETNLQPLSHGQRALWFLAQIAPESAAYNVASAVSIKTELDIVALRSVFQKLLDRHPALRTTFKASAQGEPSQLVHARMKVAFRLEDATDLDAASLKQRLGEESHRPFDLESGPLFRVHLFRQKDAAHVLLLVAHHINVDFWSLALLMQEMGELYRTEADNIALPALAPLAADYADYVRRQHALLGGEAGARLADFWQQELAGSLPVLDLHTDRPRPPLQTYRGASEPLRFDATLTRRLKELSREQNATLYMTLLAAWQTLLYRYTGQEDLLVGSPTSGRNSARFARTVGYFVNPVVLRSHLQGETHFVEFLQQTRRTVLDAFAHDEYPFDLLVKRLQPERDPARSPLFQVMFAFNQAHLLKDEGLAAFALGEEGARMELGGLTLESVRLEQRVAQFDLALTVAEVGDELAASLEYNSDLFQPATIRRMLRNLQTLLEAIVARPSTPLARLDMLTPVERRQLLDGWNGSQQSEDARPPMVHQLFEQHAASAPERVAVVYENRRVSYGELNERANRLAHYLRSCGVGPDVPVVICLERSIEILVAMFGVIKAGGAYVPVDPTYPAERIAYMLGDVRAPVLVTQQTLVEKLPAAGASRVILLDADWEVIERERADNPVAPPFTNHLAYIIYTSGSTGQPKGVMVAQQSLGEAYQAWREAYQLDAVRSVLQMASFSFDVFTEDTARALCTGAKLVLCPKDLLFAPEELYALMQSEEVDFADFVPAVLRALVQHLEQAGRRLEYPRVLVSGADALYVEDFKKLQQLRGGDTRLINSFGITETTIDNTVFEDTSATTLPLDGIVPIGRPFANARAYVLDRWLEPVPVGVAGELYIGGSCVARGYLNRAGLTAEKFIPDPHGPDAGARLYRTGDLARYSPDGQIEFLGRNDNQVKLRGHRVELGEIEATLLQHPQLKGAVVVARGDSPGHQSLIAYVVARQEPAPDARELRSFLKERLAEQMLPSAYVLLERLPLTPNGKVDRRALPDAPALARLETEQLDAAPRTEAEKILCDIWATLLQLESVGVHDNFFESGGDSIMSIQVVARAKQSGINLTPGQIFEYPTIAQLAAVSRLVSIVVEEVHPASTSNLSFTDTGDIADVYRLSPTQQGMLFHSLYAPDAGIYVAQFSCLLRGELEVDAFVAAWQRAVDRHEILRASFVWENLPEPLQLIHRRVELPLERHDWRGLSGEEQGRRWESLLVDERRRGFDLSASPLLRPALARVADDAHRFVLTSHHLLLDGWSGALLLREVFNAYEVLRKGETPRAEPPRPYKDFIAWLERQDMARAEAFWREYLEGFNAPTPLMIERSTGATNDGQPQEFGGQKLRLTQELTARLQAFARQHQLTLNTLVQGAWALLLSRYSQEEEVVFGITLAGRPASLAGVESMVGLFINTLPARVNVPPETPLLAWLKRLQTEQARLREYEHSPLVEVQRWSDAPRDARLFESLLVFENYPADASASTANLSLQLDEARSFDRTNYPLTIVAVPGSELLLEALYDGQRFDAEAIGRLLAHLQTLLEEFLREPQQTLGVVQMLTGYERRQLLVEWSGAAEGVESPPHLCLHELFEAQAARTPDAVAWNCDGERLTYAELNERANRLAHHLQTLSVGPESLVGILLQRSTRMMVALLGVLKAGAAYLPLDPLYPQERLAYMLEDAAAAVVLTESSLSERLSTYDAQVLSLDADAQNFAAASAENPQSRVVPDNVAYVIYTSGSTGRPKGVGITHANASTFIEWATEQFSAEELSCVLAVTSICFDLSLFELFAPLCCGGKVVLSTNALALPNLAAASEVTLINTVPSAMAELLRIGALPASVGTVNLAGEPLKLSLVRQVYQLPTVNRVFNLYGPSEDTTYSTFALIKRDAQGEPTIGRPVKGTEVYLLDRQGQPVPRGAIGELYIGGAGLARGYLNRPELTAVKFVPHPFSSSKGARLYRTGDLARFNHEGEIEFLGRADHQVKIRGLRIELGEIETFLTRHAEIREAVVVAREDVAGDKRLAAYLVAQDGETPPVEALRGYLKKQLPDYMIPSVYVWLDALPLTPNGKIDRKALPAPDSARHLEGEAYVGPRNAVEEALTGIWAELLGVERIGVNDSFFDLGGHSLLATRLLSTLRKIFGLELSLREVFEATTVAKLAALLDARERTPGRVEKIARVWLKIKSASPDELKDELQRKRQEKSGL